MNSPVSSTHITETSFSSTSHLPLRSSTSSGSKLQVLSILCFLVFFRPMILMSLRFLFESEGPTSFLWNPTPPQMCFLMLLKKLCEGSPQFQSNPTLAGRVLSKMLPLTIHGDGTPVCGAGKSWSKMGDFFSWSCMLMTSGHSQLTRFLIFMVHAYMRCPNLMS